MLENFPWVLLLLIFFFGYLLDFSFLFLSSDPSSPEPMETEATGEENARGNTDDAAAAEDGAGADVPASEEAAKAAAEEAGGGSGDRTDGPGAAGRQALHRPPIPPPLLQCQAPKNRIRIATRLEEAAAAAAAGEFGFTVEEAEAVEAASLVEREEFAGEGELVGPEPSDSLPQAEPPAPPRRRLRTAGDVVGRQTSQQPPCRATRSTAASSVTVGSPHATAAGGAPAATVLAAAEHVARRCGC